MVYRTISADDEGYMALAISILTYASPDEAFRRLSGKAANRKRANIKWTPQRVEDVRAMRQSGMKWREIGEVYGLKPSTVWRGYEYHTREVKR